MSDGVAVPVVTVGGTVVTKVPSFSPTLQSARGKYLQQAQEMEDLVAVALEDKEILLGQLQHFVLSARQKLLVKALAAAKTNPEKSVRDILLTIPMSALEFLNILREVRLAFSNFQVAEIVDYHRPKVVEAVMKSAVSVVRECLQCKGKGKVTTVVPVEESDDEKEAREAAGGKLRRVRETVTCSVCYGEGKTTTEPEHARQITALEVAGVLKKGGPGVAVTVNTSNNNVGWRSSPDFRKETDKLMYGGQVVDVEVEKEEKVEEKKEKRDNSVKFLHPPTEAAKKKAEIIVTLPGVRDRKFTPLGKPPKRKTNPQAVDSV